MNRTIAIKGPFQGHPAQDVHWAHAAVVTPQEIHYVIVSVPGFGQTGLIDGGAEQISDDEMEEGMMLFGLIELARLSLHEIEPNNACRLREVRVAIPAGPGRRGEWTINEIREYTGGQLRSFDLSCWGATWEARPKRP